jgi:hypothetical protein
MPDFDRVFQSRPNESRSPITAGAAVGAALVDEIGDRENDALTDSKPGPRLPRQMTPVVLEGGAYDAASSYQEMLVSVP